MKICYIPGDGIGPELMKHALRALDALGSFSLVEAKAGYDCFRESGKSLPDESLASAKAADAVLFSALTSPPESVADYRSPVLQLRKGLDLYANVRPCRSYPNVKTLFDGIDLTIVRENTEGMYSGIEWVEGESAFLKRVVTKKGSERVVRFAFEWAKCHGKGKVTVVHKANVLRKTCGLFLQTAKEVARDYPEIEMEDVIVDAMAMRLIKHPQDFQVIVTTNLFGDILSDEAAQLVGGLGMTPSMNKGDSHALFEPTHGSAPKYAGKDVVNPCAMMLSTAMMLDHLGQKGMGERLRSAVVKTLSEGKKLTKDLGGTAKTSEMVEEIVRNL
ncbi:MAG TPA: isocitrate/isopropylmalate dehydrogenase family protein [Candidatus Bilamarchaeum sp.]|nr:isocitrate/isopropylmalate dehydrogenase family protein [Candidatus Bilamarchaeum sp.]